MKIKSLILYIFSLLLITSACDDDLNSVGIGTKPERDNVTVYPDTVYLKAHTTTIKADPVYFDPNINVFLLGNFIDPLFGSLKADFINQFYATSSIFPETTESVDTVFLKLKYDSWLGDSIAPMVAKVYPATNDFNNSITDRKYKYTDIDLAQYASSSAWVTKTYTARDLSISDAVYYKSGYVKNLKLDISNGEINGEKIGTAFYNKWKNDPATFDNINAFRSFFPGLYVTTTSGTGNVLKLYSTELHFVYKYKYTDGEGVERDSTGTTILYSTSDLLQSCQYKNSSEQFPIGEFNRDTSYIKSPAGVYTQYTIPLNEIAQKIAQREINSVMFSVSSYPKDDWKYALNPPTKLMMIRKDSLENFFSESHSVAAPTSYKASFSNNTYNFSNISSLIRQGISEGKTELDVVLVPIFEKTTYTYYGTSQYLITIKTGYDISPAGVKLRTDNNYLRLLILSSDISQK